MSRALLILPTGTGKTVVAGTVAKHSLNRVLFMSHREEINSQAAGTFEQIIGEAPATPTSARCTRGRRWS
jgi:superfamily II DNA or RNA helicase